MRELLQYMSEEGLEAPQVSGAEVTYSNVVPVLHPGESIALTSLLAPWSGTYSDDFLPEPEDGRFGVRYRIPDPSTGQPIGRLYVNGASMAQGTAGWRASEAGYVLQLFARGKPLGEGLEGALAFMDLGHEWVVRGFSSITTPSMHHEWGRQERCDDSGNRCELGRSVPRDPVA